MTRAGRESLRPSTSTEILGAWEVLNDPYNCRYFVITEDLLGWIPGSQAIENASRTSLSEIIDTWPSDKWKPADWKRFTFSDGRITEIEKAGVEVGYHWFRTAMEPAS